MLHDTQRASAPALHELLSTVSVLRDDILAESEELYNSWQSRIERSEFVPSAQNLAAYLRVSRRINGRVIVTNYDPAVLSNEERFLLHEQAEEAPFNDILVDIRPGYPGGELSLHGRLRLRSFHEILTFIGRGIEEEPEYDVPPDPRTPPIRENPPRTLEILEARRLPPGVDLSVSLKGYQYAVQPQSGYQWNRKAFSLLYQLFRMTVATVPSSGPAITISK